ncbi:glucan biosynthesis protein [Rhizorhapis sp. SPR117]|uniref:glucan biosynthesis protein n=1 Tax=Rhizorhapis sp. SPR117 TaxID=2912611 RepID=UPI001F26358F|nr:glucan biosynthesis protein [Rhizorhapis sp. SPR117]
MTTRRDAIFGLAGLLMLPSFKGWAATGKGKPFSWDMLKDQALALSRQPAQPIAAGPALLDRLDYDAVAKIEFRPDKTLWGDYEDATGVRFFPLSKYARQPVSISVVEGGVAHAIDYSPSLYNFPPYHPMAPLGKAGGFSGFRIMNKGGIGDWMAFQGASYFRSAGPLHQYGLSARGIAIDTGLNKPEEFPNFTRFWLERGADDSVITYALLEGPSVTGAYRIVNRQEADQMVQDVSTALYMRDSVERLGIAPLTSMFWYDEGHRTIAHDWRPEIHDSDGLAMHTGAGERIWRPLNNPPRPQINSFADHNPRGFGLMQRDRNFDHYQDDGVFYEKRPNLWIEPKGDWGAGAVTLYEIPTAHEIDDNIVAFWTPAMAAKSGTRFAYDYRMRWIAGEPEALPVARVINCWSGQGGNPGQPVQEGVTKIVVDFAGDRLEGRDHLSPLEPVFTVTNGKVTNSGCYHVHGLDNVWRLVLDIERSGAEPSDIRAYLRFGHHAFTETFLYQIF